LIVQARKSMRNNRLRMLIVGAFPRRNISEHGGVLTSCRVLLASSLPQRADLVLVDSSSPSVPPPPIYWRLLRALTRMSLTFWHFVCSRPHVALFFASPGSSLVEKSVMAGIAKVLGIRTLMFPRGAQIIEDYHSSFLGSLVLRAMFSIPDKMLCQGKVYQDFFIDCIGMSKERCPILANWTATNELLQIGASRSYLFKTDQQTLLFLGWIENEKGIFELLDCVKALASNESLPPIKLVMAGNGSALGKVKRFLLENRLEAYVELPGWVDIEKKHECLRKADIFVLPSHMEGMPNALIEAMAAGLPVVATNVGAVPEMLESGTNGIVVEPRDPHALLAAVALLLSSRELRISIGQAAWRTAKEAFGAETAVDRLMELSEEISGFRGSR